MHVFSIYFIWKTINYLNLVGFKKKKSYSCICRIGAQEEHANLLVLLGFFPFKQVLIKTTVMSMDLGNVGLLGMNKTWLFNKKRLFKETKNWGGKLCLVTETCCVAIVGMMC